MTHIVLYHHPPCNCVLCHTTRHKCQPAIKYKMTIDFKYYVLLSSWALLDTCTFHVLEWFPNKQQIQKNVLKKFENQIWAKQILSKFQDNKLRYKNQIVFLETSLGINSETTIFVFEASSFDQIFEKFILRKDGNDRKHK